MEVHGARSTAWALGKHEGVGGTLPRHPVTVVSAVARHVTQCLLFAIKFQLAVTPRHAHTDDALTRPAQRGAGLAVAVPAPRS